MTIHILILALCMIVIHYFRLDRVGGDILLGGVCWSVY